MGAIDNCISPILLSLPQPSWSAFLPCVLVMASKTSVSSLARKSLTTSNILVLTVRRAYSHFPPTRRRRLLQQSRHDCPLIRRKTFSTTPRQGLADVDDSFDPLQQDRESDEVDVCIVGGGTSYGTLHPSSMLMYYRARWPQRSNSPQTDCQRSRKRRFPSSSPRESRRAGRSHRLRQCHRTVRRRRTSP